MSLLKLADLVGKLVEGLLILLKKMRIAKKKEKIDEGLEEGDQRKIEDAFGGSSGPSDPNKFPGLFKRERKKE